MYPQVISKTEGKPDVFHGHVTALSISPPYRRLRLAKILMDELERLTDEVYNGWFVDLFVRVSNSVAIGMYRGFGYTVFRRVVGYYSEAEGEPGEDAFDMRKPCSRDKDLRHQRKNGEEYRVSPSQVYF